MTTSKIAVTPLYVITVQFKFGIKWFGAKVSSTRSNKRVLSFCSCVNTTRLQSVRGSRWVFSSYSSTVV